MDKYYSQIIGTPVVTSVGHLLGRVRDIVLNTDTGKVAGFLLFPGGQRVIVPMDIISLGRVIELTDDDAVLEINEIQQVQKVVAEKQFIMGKKVLTKSGNYLGKVLDYAIHDKMFVMTKIMVAKSILGIIQYDRKLIAHREIVEITPTSVIVKNPLRPIPASVKMKKIAPVKKLSVDPAITS